MENKNLNIDKETFLAKWLENEIGDAEFRELVSSDDFIFYQKLKKGFHVSEQLDAPVNGSFVKIQERISMSKKYVRPLYRNWSIGIAASLALFFGLFSIFNSNTIAVETGFGETRAIALLDGSEVILNSRSKLTYSEDDWEENRTLNLEGEAYFKVEKGNTFTVKTSNGSVTVLGTQFNVNSRADFFDVVCYEGKVRVKTLASKHILLPSNSVRKINGDAPESSITNIINPTWLNGESTFKSVPVRYVISALEAQYNIEFDTKLIDDSILFSGSFPHSNLNTAFQTVFETLQIKYIEKGKRNIKLRY